MNYDLRISKKNTYELGLMKSAILKKNTYESRLMNFDIFKKNTYEFGLIISANLEKNTYESWFVSAPPPLILIREEKSEIS